MNTSNNVIPGRRHRRTHSAEFKAQVVAACRTPGVSIAAVALERRLNANLLRRWVVTVERARAGGSMEPRATPACAVADVSFVPVEVQTPMAVSTQEIVIELRRGATAIKVTWPLTAAKACATWLGQWLR